MASEMFPEGLRGIGRGTRVLLERDRELAELDRLLVDGREGRGRASLIEGEAGIGKTALLDEARERAITGGMTVLAARGGELERDFSFGIVRQLLEPVLANADAATRAQLFAGAARLAGPVFEATPERAAGEDPDYSVLHGLYWLTANVAERRPLLLAIDDLHWSDKPSLRFLLYLVRRLEGVRAAVALATRTGGEEGPMLLRKIVLESRLPILRPHPLSEDGVARVVRAALGPDAEAKLCSACHESTGGNPFLLNELIEELRCDSRPADAISPVAASERAPERIAVAILLRVGGIDPAAPALVRALAVLGAGGNLTNAAALADLDLTTARALIASLADAAILKPGDPPRFVHPIVRTAIYEDMTEGDRAALHRRAAGLLADQGAEAESIALHLLACDPMGDPSHVAALRRAARAALARGAAETATRYLRRALSEPPPDSIRPELLFELGRAAARAGEADGLELMREGFELTSDPGTKAAAGLELGAALGWEARRVGEGVLVLERALDGAQEPHVRDRIEAGLLLFGVLTASSRARVAERLQAARGRLIEFPDEVARMRFGALAVDVALSGGTAAEAAQLAKRALAGGFPLREQVEGDLLLLYPPLWVLIQTGHLAAADAALRGAAAQARARGSALGVALASSFVASERHRAGELPAAEAAARTCLDMAAEADWGIPTPIAAATLAAVLVERGQLEEARAILGQLESSYDPEVMTSQVLRESRAKLRMAERNPQGALDELLAIAHWERTMNLAGAVVPVPWRSAAALAHAALGDGDRARRFADDEVVLARRFGVPRPIGVALRALGLVEGGERGIALLEDSVRALEAAEDRLEHARALVDLGSALRRAARSREARERLVAGMDLAHRCHATSLVERAHEQLRLAGARPRRMARTGLDALTPSERRVSELAASGMPNKEIAQALFVTLRTVEMHLSNAYRKLSIDSRRKLAGALTDRERDVERRSGDVVAG